MCTRSWPSCCASESNVCALFLNQRARGHFLERERLRIDRRRTGLALAHLRRAHLARLLQQHGRTRGDVNADRRLAPRVSHQAAHRGFDLAGLTVSSGSIRHHVRRVMCARRTQRFNLGGVAFEHDDALAAQAERGFLGQLIGDQDHGILALAAILRQRQRRRAIAGDNDVMGRAQIEDARKRAAELTRKRKQQTNDRRGERGKPHDFEHRFVGVEILVPHADRAERAIERFGERQLAPHPKAAANPNQR